MRERRVTSYPPPGHIHPEIIRDHKGRLLRYTETCGLNGDEERGFSGRYDIHYRLIDRSQATPFEEEFYCISWQQALDLADEEMRVPDGL